VEQELLSLPDHLRSPSIFSGVRLVPSYISLFVPLSLFFWPLHCLVSPLSIYGFWLLLCFLQSFFIGLVLVLCVVLWFFDPVYLFLWPLCCVVYPSSTHGFWLPLWYLQTFLIVFKLWWFSNNQLVTLLDGNAITIYHPYSSKYFTPCIHLSNQTEYHWDCRGRDRMAVGFKTVYAISLYQH